MAAEELGITIEIQCVELPGAGYPSLHLGIQRDKSIIEMTSADSKRIVFNPTLRARPNADGSVNFLGPFAHGPKAERFIYLNWVTMNGNVVIAMVGRIKLHLNHIKWTKVQRAAGGTESLRVEIALTNAKGKPVMASVRPPVARWLFP